MNLKKKKKKTKKETTTIKTNQPTNQKAQRFFQPGYDMNLILILQSHLPSMSRMVKDSWYVPETY